MTPPELKTIDKATLAALPVEKFTGRIELVQTPTAEIKALRFLMDQPLVGFDTESRPAFRKGQQNHVALMQLSTDNICFLFRLNRLGISNEMQQFLSCKSVTKIGLSIKDDFHMLNRLAPIEPAGFVELQQLVANHGIGEASLAKIYAVIFGKRISKGQRLTNWEAVELTPAQQHYAALDAWACLQIYHSIVG